MKTTLLLLTLLLCSCDPNHYWVERQIPTTDEERKAIIEHVEKVLPQSMPQSVSGDDQDHEDVVHAIYKEARTSICRVTLWEYNDGYTGRWKYADETK